MDLEIRRHYVAEAVKLKLWYVKWLLHIGVNFEEAVQRHVDIYRMTSLYDGNKGHHPTRGWSDPLWRELRSRLKSIYDKYPGHPGLKSTSKLEEEGLAVLWPYLEKRIQMGAKIVPRKRPYGCFGYEYQGDYLHLHFSNAVAPESPFHDMASLAESLYKLLIDSQERRPEILKVNMTSWLNTFLPFLTLFPPTWSNSAKPLGPDYGHGTWGQFINRRGDFHSRNAAFLRKTGQFPYVYSYCECSINELKDYLEKNYIKAQNKSYSSLKIDPNDQKIV